MTHLEKIWGFLFQDIYDVGFIASIFAFMNIFTSRICDNEVKLKVRIKCKFCYKPIVAN